MFVHNKYTYYYIIFLTRILKTAQFVLQHHLSIINSLCNLIILFFFSINKQILLRENLKMKLPFYSPAKFSCTYGERKNHICTQRKWWSINLALVPFQS